MARSRHGLHGPRFPSFDTPPESSRITPSIAHPYRALPPGQQYLPHQGRGERARRLRQQLRALEKQAKKLNVPDLGPERAHE